MELKTCFLTANDCYKKGTKMTGAKPTGIVVHSTGANNKELKRYVQPLKTDTDYETIITDLGVNKYGNHWNRSSIKMGRRVCVHAFIGINSSGKVETYQTLPFDMCCWGVGSGNNGSYNNNPTARVQFEICEDNLKDEAYFNAAFKEAVEFCAYLCKAYGLGSNTISSHAESHKAGYGSNHSDCDHWLKKFGKNMDWFRAEVDKLIKKETVSTKKTNYYVQTGAYSSKDNAVKQLEKVKAAGFDAILKKSNTYFRVQVGAYSNKTHAEKMEAKLKTAGFDTYITKSGGTVVSARLGTESNIAFKVGDKVKCKDGVTKFADGEKMRDWVPKSTLYVRAIESDGKILLVSTEKTKKEYTGRVTASDMIKI